MGAGCGNSQIDSLPKRVTKTIAFSNGQAKNLSCQTYFGIPKASVISVCGTDAFYSTVFDHGRQSDFTKFDLFLPMVTSFTGSIACDIVFIPDE